jgi:phosphate starvation-inducible PhoH-like protein
VLEKFVKPQPARGQEEYVRSIQENTITICTGYAGTGKTFLALAEAIHEIKKASRTSGIKRVVIIRPYVPSNTGEKLGALPGTLDEKVTPYVQSVKDNLRQFHLNESQITQLINQHFEFTILSMCRGRSFNDCFVIVEEAQNVPIDGDAMKMILTRVGKNCKLVIAGDLDQCDIPSHESGLAEAINVLDEVEGIGIVEMEDVETIQRSKIVKEVIKAYNRVDRRG